MEKISRKYSNRDFAPGLALYGIDGKDGVSGESGCSLFVCQYDFNDDDDVKIFGTKIKQGLAMTGNGLVPIGRSYINGDVFLFPSGYLYKIINIDEIFRTAGQMTKAEFQEYMEYVGTIDITSSSDIFDKLSGRLVLNTEEYKGFIINVSDMSADALKNISSPFAIVSDQESRAGKINFIGLQSIYSGSNNAQLQIYYDTNNNAYVIESDRDILINTDLWVNSSDDDNKYDDYSKVLTSENSMTSFSGICNNLSWKMEYVKDSYEPDDDVKKTNEIYYDGYDNGRQEGKTIAVNDNGQVIIRQSADSWLWQFDLSQFKTKWLRICLYRSYTTKDTATKFDLKYFFMNGEIVDERNPGAFFYRNPISASEDTTSGWDYEDKKWHADMFYSKEQIFIPHEANRLVVSVPVNVYVIVFGDGENIWDINDTIEANKRYFINNDYEISGSDNVRGFDSLQFSTLRYQRRLTLYNDSLVDYNDTLSKCSIHLRAFGYAPQDNGATGTVSRNAYSQVMEYVIRLNNVMVPTKEEPLEIDIFGDYPAKKQTNGTYSDEGLYTWNVSLIGSSEMYIKEK